MNHESRQIFARNWLGKSWQRFGRIDLKIYTLAKKKSVPSQKTIILFILLSGKPREYRGCYVRLNNAGGVRRSVAAPKAEGAFLSPAWRKSFDRKTFYYRLVEPLSAV